jgi:hypothetical protein
MLPEHRTDVREELSGLLIFRRPSGQSCPGRCSFRLHAVVVGDAVGEIQGCLLTGVVAG